MCFAIGFKTYSCSRPVVTNIHIPFTVNLQVSRTYYGIIRTCTTIVKAPVKSPVNIICRSCTRHFRDSTVRSNFTYAQITYIRQINISIVIGCDTTPAGLPIHNIKFGTSRQSGNCTLEHEFFIFKISRSKSSSVKTDYNRI